MRYQGWPKLVILADITPPRDLLLLAAMLALVCAGPAFAATPDWHNVKDYGAVGNGSANDTSAIQSAINATQTTGGTVYFPVGTYNVTTTINVANGAGQLIPTQAIALIGDSSGSSVIQATYASGDIIKVTGAQITIRDIGINSTVTRTAGASVHAASALELHVQNFVISNAYIGILWDGGGLHEIRNGYFNRLTGASTSSGGGGIQITNFSTGVIDSVWVNGQNSTSTDYASYGINIHSSGGTQISNSCFLLAQINLLIDPPSGTSVYATYIDNTYFDSNEGGNAGLIRASGTGSVTATRISHAWFTGPNNLNSAGLFIGGGTGTVTDTEIDSGVFIGRNSYNSGLMIGTNSKGTIVNGGSFSGWGDGIWVDSGVSDFTITNVQSGNYGFYGGNSYYGIAVVAGSSNHYIINNNRLAGNGSAPYIDGGSGTQKAVGNNIN